MDKKNIETIYALAPLQQMFLWHSLQTSARDGLIHMRCTVHGHLDSAVLQRAWESVVDQHPALRTSVHWEGVKQPLQVVAKKVTIPWHHLDWRERGDHQAALTDFLAQDRECGFELTQVPITRLALIRLEKAVYELVWSCHHLMLDGWSGALVLNQVFDYYEILYRGESPIIKAAPPTYQSYIHWLKQQDKQAAEEFWRAALKGVEGATRLPVVNSRPGRAGFDSAQTKSKTVGIGEDTFSSVITFSVALTNQVQMFLRSHHLTLNTLMQGIWALLLHSYSDNPDILFGATVSGRQGDLTGVESIVGLLINVLPIRVKISKKQEVLSWLQTLQTLQAKASRYAYVSPDQIQSWSQVSGRLFDSLLVIENYPIQTRLERSLHVETMQSGLVSTYGLTVIVKPGNELAVILQAKKLDDDVLTILLNQFQTILEAIVETPEQRIEKILSFQERIVENCSTEMALTASNLSRDQLEGCFFAPSNSLELKLVQIWESVLGVSPLSIDDNFFDVGGDSLLAVQLFNQMQQKTGCTLPLASLFQAPNVRQFAVLLSQDQPISRWSSLVPIQSSGAKIPLFFHGGSADALTWARFSYLLGTERPFYALQRPDLNGSEVIHTTVEELATDCIKEMRMVQPKGPYLVGGHCLGGSVAFEIAQQLQADGEDVVSVVLIDSYHSGELPETVLVKLQSNLQLGMFWVRKNYYYHGGWAKLTELPRKIWRKFIPTERVLTSNNHAIPVGPNEGDIQSRQVSNSDQSNAHLTHSNEFTVSYEYRYARAQKANETAAERYVAQPYAGRVKLFRADIQILDWYFGQELGWQTVVKDGVELTKIPGFFGNLFNQHSTSLLAEQVREYLAKLP